MPAQLSSAAESPSPSSQASPAKTPFDRLPFQITLRACTLPVFENPGERSKCPSRPLLPGPSALSPGGRRASGRA